MASIDPFRAWRYNPATVRLEDVVTQPYDKISPAMQQAYYQPALTIWFASSSDCLNSRSGARRKCLHPRRPRLPRLARTGHPGQEKDPAIYAYSQRFQVPGTDEVNERRGFIALGKLHDYADKVVFRHEQTLSKPKSDRLNLLKATRAHFGQIFMLYSDPAGSVEKILFEGSWPSRRRSHRRVRRPPSTLARHRSASIRLLTAMADKKLIIADGHHRYETALELRQGAHARHRPSRAEHDAHELPHPAIPRSRRHDDLRQHGLRRPRHPAHASRRPRPRRI